GLLGLFRRGRTRRGRAWSAGVLLVGGFAGWVVLSQAWVAFHPWTALQADWHRLAAPPARTHATGVSLDRVGRVDIGADQLERFRQMIALIQARAGPQDRVFDFSNQAAFLFFADRGSAT